MLNQPFVWAYYRAYVQLNVEERQLLWVLTTVLRENINFIAHKIFESGRD